MTFTKLVAENGNGFGVAPYVSVNYSGYDKGINFPFGAAIAFGRSWTLLPMYDGRRGHTTLTWSAPDGRSSVTLISAFNKRFGLSVGRNY